MDDLIRRSDVKDKLKECLKAVLAVMTSPAVDAVEVVRCADCKWCHAGFCEFHDDIIPWGAAHTRWREWFCADGQRREEEHNAVDRR